MKKSINGFVKNFRYLCIIGIAALGLISIVASGGGGGGGEPSRLSSNSEVIIEWVANTEPDLAGYRLYQSDTSGVYTFGAGNEFADIPVGTETMTIDNVPDGTWYWVLTAYDTEGLESAPSKELETSQLIAFRR